MLEKLPESIGHALVNQRAGMENVVYNELQSLREPARLTLRSDTFVFNGRLPTRFTADGEGISPPLTWDDVPDGTGALALIVEDADSPTPHPLVHAIAIGLEHLAGELAEGALVASAPGGQLVLGQNSFLKHAWLPPDPPRGHGEHRYVFQLFALRAGAAFTEVPGRKAFIQHVLEHATGVGCLIGTYERSERATTSDAAVAAVLAGPTPA